MHSNASSLYLRYGRQNKKIGEQESKSTLFFSTHLILVICLWLAFDIDPCWQNYHMVSMLKCIHENAFYHETSTTSHKFSWKRKHNQCTALSLTCCGLYGNHLYWCQSNFSKTGLNTSQNCWCNDIFYATPLLSKQAQVESSREKSVTLATYVCVARWGKCEVYNSSGQAFVFHETCVN